MKQIFRWHVAVQHVKCYLTDPIASHTIIVRWFDSGPLVIFVASDLIVRLNLLSETLTAIIRRLNIGTLLINTKTFYGSLIQSSIEVKLMTCLCTMTEVQDDLSFQRNTEKFQCPTRSRFRLLKLTVWFKLLMKSAIAVFRTRLSIKN